MAKLNEWDFFNRNVQSGLTEGQFLAAQFTLIAAGPPNLAFLSDINSNNDADIIGSAQDNIVFPMGITQAFQITQTRQHARVWEIGSERSYWISGRTVGQIALGRLVYHGPNLLRSLYAYYRTDATESRYPFDDLLGNGTSIQEANENRNPHSIQISPGYRNIFLNLASDLFAQTIGLLVYFKDSNNESVYATYAENCVIPNHGLRMDAGGTVMQENATLQFERLVPVYMSNSLAVADIDSSHKIMRPGGAFTEVSTGRNY